MKHQRKWRKPSPAMIVAIAALVVSIGGTAVAGPIAEISLNKGEKKQVRKITRKIAGKVSNNRITQRAPGLSVATANIANVANAANVATNAKNAEDAENAENAENAEKAENAETAEFAEVGLPTAYALVNANGTVDSEFTDGIPNGTLLPTGIYCFNLSFSPIHAQVSSEADTESNDLASVEIKAPFANCPAGTDVEVQMWETELDAPTTDSFLLTVW